MRLYALLISFLIPTRIFAAVVVKVGIYDFLPYASSMIKRPALQFK